MPSVKLRRSAAVPTAVPSGPSPPHASSDGNSRKLPTRPSARQADRMEPISILEETDRDFRIALAAASVGIVVFFTVKHVLGFSVPPEDFVGDTGVLFSLGLGGELFVTFWKQCIIAYCCVVLCTCTALGITYVALGGPKGDDELIQKQLTNEEGANVHQADR